MSSPLISCIQVVVAALLFSTGGAVVKSCGLSGWQVASFRCGAAAIFLLLVVPMARRGWSWRIAGVGAAFATTLVLYVLANKTTTAANAIFLQSTAPLYLLLLGPWLLREPVRRSDLALLGGIVLGLALVAFGPQLASATAPSPLLGNLFGAGAGLAWALTVLGLRWLEGAGGAQPGAGMAAVATGSLIAFTACLPMALPVTSSRPVDWVLLIYLGIFQVALAYVFLTVAVRRMPAFEASLLLLVEPVMSPVWAWWIHGEQPNPWALMGGGIILLATTLKTWIDFRHGAAAKVMRRSALAARSRTGIS